MICYHHNDLDGKASACVLHRYHPDFIQDDPNSYVQCTYESPFNKHTIKDDVFILDLSINEKSYNRLIETCKTARTVTLIDHHKTTLDIISDHFEELQSISNLTYFVSECACGAALTYAFLHIPVKDINRFRNTDVPAGERYYFSAKYNKKDGSIDVSAEQKNVNNDMYTGYISALYNFKLPQWLYYVDDHDCWKKLDKNTEFFVAGCSCRNTAFVLRNKISKEKYFNPFWSVGLEGSFVTKYIDIGKNASEYMHSRYFRELCLMFEWDHDGTKFICKNGTGNSEAFENTICNYPAAILFYYSGRDKKWNYNVYSSEKSNFDCEKFCKMYGGGGHMHAAGFSSEHLIFIDNNINKKRRKVFLGGTCNGDDWREYFISEWKKITSEDEYEDISDIELFNPVVEDWTPECMEIENEEKENDLINLFVITPKMLGVYSIAEAVECAHNGKVAFIIYDKFENSFDKHSIKSFNATGKIIEKHGGAYKYFAGENSMVDLVKFVADYAKSL